MPEHILILTVASSEDDKLSILCTDLVHHVGYQIQSFLVGQTGYKTNHKLMFILFQSQFSLQGQFIFYFHFPEVDRIIIIRQSLICLRIILIIINTIQNTAELSGTGTEQSVQTFTVERHLNLFRISWTDRRNPVRIDKSAFQIIGILISFQLVRRKQISRQTGNVHNIFWIPCSLEFQIMNRHDCFHPGKEITAAEICL